MENENSAQLQRSVVIAPQSEILCLQLKVKAGKQSLSSVLMAFLTEKLCGESSKLPSLHSSLFKASPNEIDDF